MKNILFYLQRYPGMGGIEIITTKIASYLVDHGVNIFVYSPLSASTFTNIDSRIKIVHFASNDNTNLIKNLASLCRQEEIKTIVIHDNYDINIDVVLGLSKQINCRVITVEHSDPLGVIKGTKSYIAKLKLNNLRNILWRIKNYNYEKKVIYRYLDRKNRLFEASEKYILLAEGFRMGLKECISNYMDSKVIIINNPLTLPIIRNNKREKNVIFISRLEGVKRIDLMLEIFARVAASYPLWTFQIYGDGAERSLVENFIKSNCIQNIEYNGPTKSVGEVLLKGGILIMTSEFEGWGLVLTEAMANGAVPIAFDSYSAVHDIIDDGINGILVSPFDIDEYCQKLSDLMDDAKRLSEMREAAYSKALNFLIEKKIGQQWVDLLANDNKTHL